MAFTGKFPSELKTLKYEIEKRARFLGLDFFDVIFEVLDYDEMNQIAAYGGFPVRYPHWRFGMEYERCSKGYLYGLYKIYEIVINNDPCYAYLLRGNQLVDQKLVMAHVYAHCDFFKNNLYFAHTDRKMMDRMGDHAAKIFRFVEKFGFEAVESFIDTCHSIEHLIDPHAVAIKRRREKPDPVLDGVAQEEDAVHKLPSKSYMDSYINPKEFLEQQKKRLEEEKKKEKQFPEEPEKDVLWFLIQHAPLEDWQAQVLSMLREEAYYFAPQGATKIMNEGWASYWHSKMMTGGLAADAEIIDYADHHSGTMGARPGVVNPYKLGLELFRDIEDRWNKGRFGSEYEECDYKERKDNWDLKLGLGREKIFEVRRICNDVTFIDRFLTEEFCREQRLFTFAYNKEEEQWEIESREFRGVKQRLLFLLTNFGQPLIYVQDGNYKNRGELFLSHRHEGVPLKMDYAKETIARIYKIWTRPIWLETVIGDKPMLVSFNGQQYVEAEIKRD